jgi:HK97 family phage portal protein
MSEQQPDGVGGRVARYVAQFFTPRAPAPLPEREEPRITRSAAEPQALSWAGISWDEFLNNGMASGVAVNEARARSVAAVIACVNLIGGSIASLPLHFYRRSADGERQRNNNSALWWFFNERPLSNWSASAMWQFFSDSRMFHGDAFALLHRSPSGALRGIEPWHPGLVDVVRDTDGRMLYYLFARPGIDPIGTRTRIVEMADMLHVPGPGFDGRRSPSMLRSALTNAAGIAAAADEQSASFMADGARPDFAIEVPGTMDPEQREALRQSWVTRHTGQGAKKAPVVLAGGMKLHQLTMSSEDAQLISTRGFQVEEICRVFGVPPFMIGHTEKTTSWGSGVEQMSIGFVKYTLQRHLVAFEQEINHKLFSTAGNFCEFVTAGLERGDIKTRMESYRIALGRAGEKAWMRPSEVRALENLPPDAELDAEPTPAAMSASQPNQTPEPAPAS